MKFHLDDTIVAIGSAAGVGSRGIVRVSGPQAVAIVDSICQPSISSIARPTRHRATLATAIGHVPAALHVWPDRISYTRQPSIEVHCAAAAPVLNAVLQQLVSAGARQANAGEFTLRAFLAGRVDLTQAEAIIGVIDAQSPAQLNSALQQLAGGLGQPLNALRQDLLELLADLEAGLDFVEDDIEFVSAEQVTHRLQQARAKLAQTRHMLDQRSVFTDRPRVVLYGRSNAGKSALFNALLEEDRSLVSPRLATTRDAVSADVEWMGQALTLVDTAGHFVELGIRSLPDDSIDRLAIEAMRKELDRAAVRVKVSECTAGQKTSLQPSSREPDQNADKKIQQWTDRGSLHPHLVIHTKADLCEPLVTAGQGSPIDTAKPAAEGEEAAGQRPLVTSSLYGTGIEAARSTIVQLIKTMDTASSHDSSTATLARCKDNLENAIACLERALAVPDHELIAEELRRALREIGQVTGEVYTDDILDQVFSRFCIGK